MTLAKLRLAQAPMGKPETKVDDLCAELAITRHALSRFVSQKGELRGDGEKLHDRRKRGNWVMPGNELSTFSGCLEPKPVKP
ncbi:hypothetical protein N185_16945 [Sinorhizobium sp. GW3]|nr:hypothetical protein N185_16945 [Sinorhizobium sp. GW3]